MMKVIQVQFVAFNILNGGDTEHGKGHIVTLFSIFHSINHTLKNILPIHFPVYVHLTIWCT